MKTKKNLGFGLTAIMLVATAQAEDLYWDTNGTDPDFGFTTLTWGSDANWTTDSDGSFLNGVTDTTTSADAAIFHRNDVIGLLSVNVSGDVYANNLLQFANGGTKATTFNSVADETPDAIHLYSTSSTNGLAAIDGNANDSNLTVNVPVVLHQDDASDVYFGVGGGNNGGLVLTGGVTHAVPENSVNLYFNNAGNTTVSGGTLDIKGTVTNTGGASNLVKSVTISANIGSAVTTVNQSSGVSHVMVLSGTNSYTGASTANSGNLQFNSLAAIGGTGKSVVANLGGAIGFGSAMSDTDLATALATRIDPNSTGGIAVNGNTARNFDFDAAGLTNVSLGASYGGSTNGQVTYTGTFTPYGDTYRLGGAGGRLIINQANALTGSNNVTVTGIGTGFSGTGGNSAVSLTNSNDYSGVTSVNSGTFVLSGAAGAITGTSGITLNGGNFTLVNVNSTEGAFDRVNNAAITSNGGTITYTNTTGAANFYAETLGSLALATGQLNMVLTTSQAGSQTLTLGGLTQSGQGTATFSSGGSLNATTNMIQVSAASETTADQIIAPWATVGTTAAAQTDYAKYDGSTNLVPAAIAASTEDTWTTAGNAYTLSGATTLTGDRTITALRYTGAASTLALAGNNLETFGILNGGSNTLTISSTGGVLRQQGTDAANLFVTTGNKAITISAPITDNTGALTLVKSGTGGTLILSGALSYSGDTAVNAGTLQLNSDNTSNDASTVTIAASGATLNLNFAGTDTVDKLFIGTTQMPAGIYGVGNIVIPQITGTGTLTVTSDPGGGPGPVDHFVISAIASPQTAGTPITGITITAQDASNQTATGFTGNVTFGGTAGCSGNTGNFVLGVLTGASTTPTLAGGNLTLTVDNGSGSTGSTTITTVLTQYQGWAGGADFDADANGDGVDNGPAWLLGAGDKDANALGLLPAASEDAGDLVLTFDCLNAADRGDAVLNVQYSNDLDQLDPWVAALVPGVIGTSDVGSVHFEATANGDLIHVVATISSAEASAGKLFGRLMATEN